MPIDDTCSYKLNKERTVIVLNNDSGRTFASLLVLNKGHYSLLSKLLRRYSKPQTNLRIWINLGSILVAIDRIIFILIIKKDYFIIIEMNVQLSMRKRCLGLSLNRHGCLD